MHDGGGGSTDSQLKLCGNIFITFIGAGILGLPYAFKEAGIIEGAVVLACVSLLRYYIYLVTMPPFPIHSAFILHTKSSVLPGPLTIPFSLSISLSLSLSLSPSLSLFLSLFPLSLLSLRAKSPLPQHKGDVSGY
eukprot:sb/3474737/